MRSFLAVQKLSSQVEDVQRQFQAASQLIKEPSSGDRNGSQVRPMS